VREIWVPSQFNMQTFLHSGVLSDKLFKIPEPLDVHVYNPDYTAPLPLPENRGFSFLSVMKWEKRKGWDILLRAYYEEFSAKDYVTLLLRSQLDNTNLAEFENFIKNITEEIKQKHPFKIIPRRPQIVDKLLPYLGMRSLYKAVDCVVQPSRGEGWGLPIIEAMAMGVPTIATNWSGNTEFMTHETSYLLDIQGLENSTVMGHRWAKPSLSHLKLLMRRIYANKNEARQIGMAGRQHAQKFSQENVANLVISRIKKIKKNLRKLLQKQH